MKTIELFPIFSLLFGAIISPFLLWLSKSIYESLRLKGTYISIMGGTGSAPGCHFRYDKSVAEGVDFSICIRIVNTTDKLQAIEDISLAWKKVHSPDLPMLKHLIDFKPSVQEFTTTDNSVESFYDSILKSKSTILPVLLQPKGGIVYLELKGNLGFYMQNNIFWKKRFFPKIVTDNAQNIVNNIERGNGIITAKISGKSRNFPVVFW